MLGTSVEAQDQQKPRWGGTLVWSLPADPQSLNPGISTGAWGQQVCANLFSGLTTEALAPNGEWTPTPVLATSWDVSSDSLTYTFHLRKGVTWHDGVPFTSADVKFSYENVLLPLNAVGKATWGMIKSITIPDDYTVVFNLSRPFAPFITYTSMLNGAILPKHVYTYPNGTIYSASAIRDKQFDLKYAIGTGPFMIKEYVNGDHVTMVRNPNYWKNDLPYLDRINYKIITQPQTRTTALESGDVDFLPMMILPSEVNRLNKTQGIVITTKGIEYAGSIYRVLFNMQKNTILKNNQVRLAIAYATNKQEISNLATSGTAPVAPTVISSDLGSWFNPNVHEPEYNLALANQLLDKAGYPRGTNGTRFTLRFQYDITYSDEENKMAQIFGDQMKTVGINIQLLPMEAAVFTDKTWMKFDYDLAIWPVTTGPDPSVQASAVFSSSNIKPGVINVNAMGYNNSEVDQLLNQASTSLDKNTRRDLFWKLQDILTRDLPTLNLVKRVYFTGYRTKFTGFEQLGKQWLWGFRDPIDNVWSTQATNTSPPSQAGQPGPTTATAFPWTDAVIAIAAIVIVSVSALAYRRRRKQN